MPRLIDYAARTPTLYPAIYRVAAEGGCEAVTVRRIASEVGLSAGALRHNFPRQGDLLELAMKHLDRDRRLRLDRLEAPTEPHLLIRALCAGALPLDDERRLEASAWLAFEERARHDPGLAAIARHAREQSADDCRDWLRWVGVPADQLDLQARRLLALIDGLTSQLCDRLDPVDHGAALAVLEAHLVEYDELAPPEPEPAPDPREWSTRIAPDR